MLKTTFLFIIMAISVQAFSQSSPYEKAQLAATKFAVDSQFYHEPKRNIYVSKLDHDLIHLFIFQDGNLLLSGFPTTATERNKFQVHLFKENGNKEEYLLQYAGIYGPTLNTTASKERAPAIADGTIINLPFAEIGPFTGSLTLTLKKRNPGADYTTIILPTIQIAKTIHASIGTGFVYTFLKDASNIRMLPLPNGDTTLVADEVNGKASLNIIATFYPWGRNNLMLPSDQFKDHFGIIVGTTFGSGAANFKNVLLGGEYDFSIGGSVIAGLNLVKRQKVTGVDYHNFEFGTSKFTGGNLENKKYYSWDAGLFIGVLVDSRIFSQIFPSK